MTGCRPRVESTFAESAEGSKQIATRKKLPIAKAPKRQDCCENSNLLARTHLRAGTERPGQIARRPSFIVANATRGIGQGFFLGREKWFETALIDRLHECFMRRHNAFFQQC